MARKRLIPAGAPVLETKSAARPPIADLAGASAAEAALREVTDDIARARSDGRMLVRIPLEDVALDHLARDRTRFDPQDMADLTESLRAHGQRTPIEVVARDGAPPYGLISGLRRMTALAALRDETGEDRFATVLARQIQPQDRAGAYRAMVEENEIRADLTHYERARILDRTVAEGVFPDSETALAALFPGGSRARRSKIRSFLEVHRALGDVLRHPERIGERLGLRLAAAVKDGQAPQLRAALAAPAADAAAEQRALDHALARPADPPAAEEIAPGLAVRIRPLKDGVALELTGAAATRELAEQILARLRR